MDPRPHQNCRINRVPAHILSEGDRGVAEAATSLFLDTTLVRGGSCAAEMGLWERYQKRLPPSRMVLHSDNRRDEVMVPSGIIYFVASFGMVWAFLSAVSFILGIAVG